MLERNLKIKIYDSVRKVNAKYNGYYHEYKALCEVEQYIKEKHRTLASYSAKCGNVSEEPNYNFSQTHNLEEALYLMKNGWDYGTVELLKELNSVKQISLKQKTIYDVQGFQCSVPRYLNGIPTNMVNKHNVSVPNKIITLNKSIEYSANISTKQIINESIKVLRLIRTLENKGYRVNLNIISGVRDKGIISITKVLIKPSNKRLNVKQLAFPLVHPAMLRRVFLALCERYTEFDYVSFFNGYGYPINDKNILKHCMKQNEYFIPAIIEETEILDIEKYRVQ